MKKRVLSILLAMLMVISLMPTTALATTGMDKVFHISAENTTETGDFTEWNAAALNAVKYLRTKGVVTVTMNGYYNSTADTSLDFGGERFILDLSGNRLGGSVKNAQNVLVRDTYSDGGYGALAASGTYAYIGEEVNVTGRVTLGTSTVTVSDANVIPYVVSYYVDYNEDYSTESLSPIEKVYVIPGEDITLRGGADIADIESSDKPVAAFGGWMVNGEVKAAGADFTPQGDTILTVAWTPYYEVAYYVADPTDADDTPAKVDSDYVLAGASTTLLSENAYAVSGFPGYTLSGWQAWTDKLDPGASYTPSSSVKLLAVFKKTECTVSYYGSLDSYLEDEDGTDGKSVTVNRDTSIELLGSTYFDLTSAGFLGWYNPDTDKMYGAGATFKVTEDTAFVAICKSDKLYNVTYDLDGATYTPNEVDAEAEASVVCTAPEGATVNVIDENDLSNFAKTGYTFKGWKYNDTLYKADGKAEGGNKAFIMPNHDVTLTAVWEQTKPYTVSYDLNGGTYMDNEVSKNTIAGKDYEEGETVTVSDVLPEYGTLEFLGWRNSNDNLLYRHDGLQKFEMPGKDVILRAEFAQKYEVDFVVEVPTGAKAKDSDVGYTEDELSAKYVFDGGQIETVNAPAPYDVTVNGVRTTYYFEGWRINGTDSLWNFADTFNASKHVDQATGKLTLTATWSTEKHYTVVFKDKITEQYVNGDNSKKEEAQYVLYNGAQLYTYYDSGTVAGDASALTLTSVSEKDTIGSGDAANGESRYPEFTRVDYTLGDSDEDTTKDWYVVKPNGKETFYYDDSESLGENFDADIDNYADNNGVITLWANWNYKYAQKDGEYQVVIDTDTLENGTYAEYYSDYIVATTDPKVVGAGIKNRIYRNFFLTDENGNAYTSETHSVSTLPDGLYLNKLTGEIYGVPKETGEFTFYVKMESDATEGAQPISAVKEITITVDALPITVDRINDAAYIYGKTYGDKDEAACNKSNYDSYTGKTYVSSNLIVKLGNALGELTTTSAAAVDGGKANVTLTGSATDKTAKLAFAYTNAKSKREAQIEKAKDPETNADWLECVDMKDVSLETVFENFTDTITFPVTRTEGEDAGSYKLYLDAKDVTYANAKASNYALTIPEAFASKDVDADAKQYVFTINPVKLTLSLSDETYTKTYGDNDPVYATNDLTTVSTNNRANATPEKSKNSTTLTLTYPMGFTDTLVVAPTRGSGEDAKSGYELSLTDSNISTSATDKADKDIAGERTGADVKENYTFDLSGYENNTLTINERTLTFTPDKSSYTYGELKPGELAGTFTGLANNESIGVVDSGVATIPEKASTAGYLNAGDYKYTTEADEAGGEGGESGSEEAVPTTDGKKINFAITNTKWGEDAANATTLADTTANYTISISPTPLAVNAATLTVTGNSVNVTKGTTPTAANIAALATLSGVLTNDGKKDDVTLSVTEYTADVNKDGTTENYNDAAALITAIGNAGGLTTNLTVTVDYTVSGSDKENYSLASGTADGTLVAYTASSGGGGGYVAPVVPSTTTDNVINSTENKTATTTATVNPATITVSGVPTTTVTVSDATGTKIVEKAVANKSAEVVINAATGTTVKEAKAGTVTEISISAATLSQIVAKTDAAVIIKSDVANVTLDRKAVEAVVATAGTSGTVKLVVKTVAQDANKVQVELKIETANGTVSDFNGGNVKVTVKLSAALAAKDLVCVYIDDNGVYYKVEGTKNADGTYTFTTGHFSSYAVMAAEDADKVIAEQAAKATDLTKDLTLKARSVKTAKGNIKVTLTVDADDVKAIEDLGYTVKYKFYRSTKKAASYKAKIEGTGKTYINTTGKKGTRYYYKARVMVYDAEGTLVAKSALKQCKYACRIR